MALDRLYPIAQKHNLLQAVQLQITDEAEEQDVTQDRAFIHVALDVLGYDYEPAAISDGRGDFGIDFIDIEEGRASIFQFKSQSFTDEIRTRFQSHSRTFN